MTETSAAAAPTYFLNILTNGVADNHLIVEGTTDGSVFLCGKKIRRNARLMVFTVRPEGFADCVLNQCAGCAAAAARQV